MTEPLPPEKEIFVDVAVAGSSKEPGEPSGDLVRVIRRPRGTLIVLADGLGHGLKARVSAELALGRLCTLWESGWSLRRSFVQVMGTQEATRGKPGPYAVLVAVEILPDGRAIALTYEAPAVLLTSSSSAHPLGGRPLALEGAIATEAETELLPGNGVILCSDGITQAGLGRGLPLGWTTDGLTRFVTEQIRNVDGPAALAEAIHAQARRLWGNLRGDDCTAVVARLREARSVCVFTGPPADRSQDHELVDRFLATSASHVVCGGTTAKLVARRLGAQVTVQETVPGSLAPPQYYIEGVELVTEGAVTLNHVHNVLDIDPEDLPPDTGVSKLCALLQAADRVEFFVGGARNLAEDDLAFRQQGILPRAVVVEKLAEKLRARWKLVVIRPV